MLDGLVTSQKALIESERRWVLALEGAGLGVWDWNAQTNKVFFSRHWKAMLGYSEREVGNTLRGMVRSHSPGRSGALPVRP